MSLYDAVGINSEKGATTEIRGQLSSICSKGCMLDDCVYVI